MKLSFTSALFLSSITPSLASAQSTDDPWTKPVNLSHSGVATNPSIVIDSDGVVHAVWQDILDEETTNYVYSRLDGDQWSPPSTTNLDLLFDLESTGVEATNYTGPNPLFIAGPNQDIFAFWLTPQGRLLTSKVDNQNFEDRVAWGSARSITSAASSFAVTVDTLGEWHLAYLSTVDDPDDPPRIYYTNSKNNGQNWSSPVLLYESPYLRTVAEGEANLSIATTGTEDAQRIYVAWDNRPRKQVFLAQSADGGETWEQPAIVAGPAPSAGLADPFSIRVGANQDSVVLVWQSGQATNGLVPICSQIYQYSVDAGATWSDPQPMIEGLSGCAQSNEFVTELNNNPEGSLHLLTETKSQVFLSAWDGREWSQPQAQPLLSGFEEPEIFTEVIYGCHRSSLSGKRLYVIGCDQGGGGDVWVTSRELDFNPPIWSQLSPVTSQNLEMEAVELVATDDGLIHTFFSQHLDPAINYSYWDGKLWSRITPVLELPEGEAAWPAVATGPDKELFLVARTDEGKLYFSRATSGNASAESRWSTPTQIETGYDGEIGLVDVTWDKAGMVYLAFSVPVNEERGIYLVKSKDHGTTWSEPIKVFDGAAAGFDFVGAPALLVSENGLLHLTWTQQAIQGDGVPQPISLHYTRSDDGGESFSDAKLIVDEPVAWREIVEDGNGNLHLLWQQQDTNVTVWDQLSLDGGNSWQIPQGLSNEGRLATVTKDSAGRLHLIGVAPGSLEHWLWDGNRWRSETPLGRPVSSQQETPIELLASAVNKNGKMMVLMAEGIGDGDVTEKSLIYTTRLLESLSPQTSTQKVPTPTVLPATLTPSAPTPEHLPTLVSTIDVQSTSSQSQTDRNVTNSRSIPYTIAILPVALLLLIVLGIVIRRTIRVEDR